jgi:hypothetical protein
MNSNRLVSAFLSLCACLTYHQSIAGTAIVFNSSYLVAFEQGKRIVGFYAAENEKFSCSFLFFTTPYSEKYHPEVAGYKSAEVFTFVQSDDRLRFGERDSEFDVRGVIYSTGDQWVLQTDTEQAGCGNGTGGFSFGPSGSALNRFSIENRFPAIGLRTVIRKSYLYERNKDFFNRKPKYLTKNDNVIVLNEKSGYSYVRFFDPRFYVSKPGAITLGWLRSADLLNPFPGNWPNHPAPYYED